MSWPRLYDDIRYKIVPPTFIVFFTSIVQLLAIYGKGEDITWSRIGRGLTGDKVCMVYLNLLTFWAIIWLLVPSKRIKGPPSPDGFVPEYQGNGLVYHITSVLAYINVELFSPGISSEIFDKMPQLLGVLSIFAFILCAYLYLNAKRTPEEDSLPRIYLFFRGRELHPQISMIDIKQFTNCRMGLMLWQLLIIVFFIVSVQRNSFNIPTFVTLILQTVYLAKFYYWEGGYFFTLDIILDRAGYYICWGCLVWVPCMYTFTSYYFVNHVPVMGDTPAIIIGLIGLISIFINYDIDAQRQRFREREGQGTIWNKPARFVKAKYIDHRNEEKTSYLLTSGYWGWARHFNYTMELCLTLCWCLPGYGLGPAPFLYFFYLLVLLVHRVFRDEEKCKRKYGDAWDEYCSIVPYRLVPFIF